MEEQDQVSELSLTDAVSSLVAELPKPVQEFIRSPDRDKIAIELAKKYQLHVDQAGIFQLAYLHMLIGVSSPEEFVKTLKEGGMSQETVSGLTSDVNEMVFKPLREKESQGSTESVATPTPQPAPPLQTITPPITPTQATPAPYAGARPQPLTPFNLPGADAHPDDLFRTATRTVAPIQTPSPAAQPVQAPVIPAPVPVAQPQRPVIPAPAQMPVEKVFTPEPPARTAREESLGGTLRTMATDMLAVNEHREPEPVQYKGTVFTPPIIMEKIPELIPVTPKPPAPPAVSSAPSAPSIQPVSRPTVTPSPSSELIKEYSSDPYREPV